MHRAARASRELPDAYGSPHRPGTYRPHPDVSFAAVTPDRDSHRPSGLGGHKARPRRWSGTAHHEPSHLWSRTRGMDTSPAPAKHRAAPGSHGLFRMRVGTSQRHVLPTQKRRGPAAQGGRPAPLFCTLDPSGGLPAATRSARRHRSWHRPRRCTSPRRRYRASRRSRPSRSRSTSRWS